MPRELDLQSLRGGGSVKVSATFTALDPRYSEGTCARCSPRKARIGADGKAHPTPDVLVPLVRSDNQRALDSLADHREQKRRRRLLEDLVEGKPMSVERKKEAEALMAQQTG